MVSGSGEQVWCIDKSPCLINKKIATSCIRSLKLLFLSDRLKSVTCLCKCKMHVYLLLI